MAERIVPVPTRSDDIPWRIKVVKWQSRAVANQIYRKSYVEAARERQQNITYELTYQHG